MELTPGERQKNYGTDGAKGPAGVYPGQDCTNPGDYSGAYVDPTCLFSRIAKISLVTPQEDHSRYTTLQSTVQISNNGG